MRLTLVRHGETTGQSSVRYYGATDVPLSGLGRAQMRHVRRALAAQRFDTAVSSRLHRAAEGAAIIVDGRAAVTPIPAFDEIDFGRWEGWTREQIERRDAENWRRWQAEGESFCYPGGESRRAFRARVSAGLADLIASPAVGHCLMVVHKGVIAVILTELLRLDQAQRAALAIDLASIHVVTGENGRWNAELLNRIDHLHSAVPASSESETAEEIG